MNYAPLTIALILAVIGIVMVAFGAATLPSQERTRLTNKSLSEQSVSQEKYPTETQYIKPASAGAHAWVSSDNLTIENYRHATYEVTRYPNADINESHLEGAWHLYNESYEAAQRNDWFNAEAAKKDGYVDMGRGNHWPNLYNEEILSRANKLNPTAPANLIYYTNQSNDSQEVLVGMMFEKALGSNQSGKQIGGPITEWHYHPQRYEKYHQLLQRYIENESIPTNYSNVFQYHAWNKSLKAYQDHRQRTPEMLHVWFVEHPGGPFGTGMHISAENIQSNNKLNRSEFKRRVIKTN